MKIKIALAGATGWVGKSLVAAIAQSADLELVTAIAPEHRGHYLGSVLSMADLTIVIAGDSIEGLSTSQAQVFVDFTTPAAVKNNVLAAIEHGMHVVIGTSGLTEQDYKEIDERARQKSVGVIAAGNFSLTATLMKHFSTIAARFINEWEIVDYASARKPDAPSGTARELAEELSHITKPLVQIPIDQTYGDQQARGADIEGTRVHSVRLPGYTLATQSIFGMQDEKLMIYHEAGNSPLPYVAGVLLAIHKVSSVTGLVRGLDRVLGL